MRTAALLLPLSLVAGQRYKPVKVIETFQKYLKSKVRVDTRDGRIKSERQRRMAEMRSQLVGDYKNATKLPKALNKWFGRVNNRGFRSSCNGEMADCTTFLQFEQIWDYGCWCQFGADAGTGGFGAPVNAVDDLCKSLTNCYKCVKIDSFADTEICQPGQTDYRVSIKSAMIEGIYMHCERMNNPDDCALHTCCCETSFIAGLLELFFNGYEFDDTYNHSSWDHTQQCDVPNTSTRVLACCGAYPERRPYNMVGSTDCCADTHLYNTDSHQCCNDGSIRAQC